MSDTENIQWPSLPTTGFISGRPATQQDVADGNAVFVLKPDGAAICRPLAITIPQYAFWMNEGRKVRVLIIQAEEAAGTHVFGFRDLSGGVGAGTGPEFELLGVSHPK